jgi:predicted ATPase/DNA-binding XRE family transcriptional regulator
MGLERSFAELLSVHRGAARLTQEELAERAGLSVGAISLLERGLRTAPRQPTVARLAAALELGPRERQSFAAAARHRAAAAPQFVALPDLLLLGTRFIGRDLELAAVTALLSRPDVRFLTLTGPPGAGKTRLAVEVSMAVTRSYRDGAVAVALGSLTDPGQVMPAIRQAFGLPESGGRSPLETVAAYCRDRAVLLLLDNLEHLLGAGQQLAELLERCPNLQLLVTSRAAARVRAEHAFAVPALRLPSAGEESAADPAVLAGVPAVSLFVDRAAAALPEFTLTAENAAAVAAICRRLDGLPLALELAAPWVRLLAPRAILDQLDSRLELLVGGPRDLPERQRTMRTTLAWSCDLLADEQRALLRRLSVFQGSAPLDALQAVCQAGPPLPSGMLRNLAVLVDHGLAGRHAAAGGEPRVTLLETVREFGRELLSAAGEREAAASAHLEYYVALAARFGREVRTAAQAAWLKRLRSELDNVRAALGWAAEHGAAGHGAAEAGLRLAASLAQFWELGGHRGEGLAWLSRLLAAPGPLQPRVLAEALKAAGDLSWRVGAHDQAAPKLRASLEIFEKLGDERGAAEATRCLGDAAGARGDHREAIRLQEKAIAALRGLDDRGSLARALGNLGIYVSRDGDRRRAVALYEEALAIHRERDDELGIAVCLTNLGHQAQLAGEPRLAESRLREAIAVGRRLEAPYYLAAALANLSDIYRERGEAEAACADYREAMALFAGLADLSGVAGCLRCLAWGAWTAGHPVQAARLYGAAEALCPAAMAYDVDDAGLYQRVRAALVQQLGAGAFAAAYEAGRRLSMREAVAEASG